MSLQNVPLQVVFISLWLTLNQSCSIFSFTQLSTYIVCVCPSVWVSIFVAGCICAYFLLFVSYIFKSQSHVTQITKKNKNNFSHLALAVSIPADSFGLIIIE